MRSWWLAVLCVASPVASDTIVTFSQPDSAVVYLEGAEVVRNLTVDLPAGRHVVILPDMPADVEYQIPRVSVANAVLGAVSVRTDAQPLLTDAETPAVVAAREQLEASEAALEDHMDAEARVRAKADAAEVQIAFLKALANNEALSSDPQNLRQVTALVGEQTERARHVILDANKMIRDMAFARKEFEEDVEKAQAALASLQTGDETSVQIAITLSTDEAVQAELSVTYFVFAEWRPLYDVALETGEQPQVSIRRGAAISQSSGEDWTDVSLALSTLSLGFELSPSEVYPIKRWFADPRPPVALQRSNDLTLEEPIVEAPVVVEEVATPVYDGPGVLYVVPERATIANSVEETLITLDTLAFPVELFARAVPLRDETAYLMARFENASNEPFLSAEETLFSIDGRLIGADRLPEIPAGAESVLAFGRIQELQLERQVLDKSEGDSGFINRSNVQDEEVRISVKNLGSETYNLELIDRVPYSEQEDLVISYTASPEPDEMNVDFERGILKWRLEMKPESDVTISLSQTLTWPEGKVLR